MTCFVYFISDELIVYCKGFVLAVLQSVRFNLLGNNNVIIAGGLVSNIKCLVKVWCILEFCLSEDSFYPPKRRRNEKNKE